MANRFRTQVRLRLGRIGVAVGLILLLVVAAVGAEQSIRQVRQKWIGKHIDQLVEVHGYPDKNVIAPNGNKVYIFVKNIKKFYPVSIYQPKVEQELDMYEPNSGTYRHGTSTQKEHWTFEQRLVNIKCAGYFEVDGRDIIADIKFKGEGCPQPKG